MIRRVGRPQQHIDVARVHEGLEDIPDELCAKVLLFLRPPRSRIDGYRGQAITDTTVRLMDRDVDPLSGFGMLFLLGRVQLFVDRFLDTLPQPLFMGGRVPLGNVHADYRHRKSSLIVVGLILFGPIMISVSTDTS